MPEPWSAWTATGTKAWYRHTAPTLIPKSVAPSASSRSRRTGSFALAHSRSTLVGVSSPCRVVRSMHVIARSSQAACHSRLTVRRVGMVAARRRSEEHTSELQSQSNLVCRLLLEKKKKRKFLMSVEKNFLKYLYCTVK